MIICPNKNKWTTLHTNYPFHLYCLLPLSLAMKSHLPSAVGSGLCLYTHSFLSVGALPHQHDTTPPTLHTKPNVVQSGKRLPGSPRLSACYARWLPAWLRVLPPLSIYPEVWKTSTVDFAKCFINVASMKLSSPLHVAAECLIPPSSSVELNY